MYVRLTPIGHSVGGFVAKGVAALVVIAAITGIVRGFGGGTSSSERVSGYYVAPRITPAPRTPVQPQPVVQPVIAAVNNLSGLVPSSPPPQPVVYTSVRSEPAWSQMPTSMASTQWEQTTIYPTEIASPYAGSHDPYARRSDDIYPRPEEDGPRSPRITYKESRSRTSNARTSSASTVGGRTEPAREERGHPSVGRPTHSADSKPSPAPSKHPSSKDEKRESRR